MVSNRQIMLTQKVTGEREEGGGGGARRGKSKICSKSFKSFAFSFLFEVYASEYMCDGNTRATHRISPLVCEFNFLD